MNPSKGIDVNSVTGYLPQAYARPHAIKGHREQPAVDLAQDRGRKEQIIEAEWRPVYGPGVSSQVSARPLTRVPSMEFQPPSATNIRYAAAKYQQMTPFPVNSRGTLLDTIA